MSHQAGSQTHLGESLPQGRVLVNLKSPDVVLQSWRTLLCQGEIKLCRSLVLGTQ